MITTKGMRRGCVRSRGTLVGWGVLVLAVAGVLGAPSASAAEPPTISAEYDGTSVTSRGVVQPSVIIRGSGFAVAAEDKGVHLLSVSNMTDPQHGYRFGYDSSSTLESKVCTHTVPSSCIVQYQAGELRPIRLFLGDAGLGNGRAFVCGDLIRASAIDFLDPPAGGQVYSNVVFLRMPCDTYTPRPPRRIP